MRESLLSSLLHARVSLKSIQILQRRSDFTSRRSTPIGTRCDRSLGSYEEALRLPNHLPLGPNKISRVSSLLFPQIPLPIKTQPPSHRSAIPANSLILASYKTTNPFLLRRRSPTIKATSRPPRSDKKGPEIVEPCFIDETAEVDPSAKIGPNVSIGAGVKVGYGCRVKDSIILDNTVLEVRFKPVLFV